MRLKRRNQKKSPNHLLSDYKFRAHAKLSRQPEADKNLLL